MFAFYVTDVCGCMIQSCVTGLHLRTGAESVRDICTFLHATGSPYTPSRYTRVGTREDYCGNDMYTFFSRFPRFMITLDRRQESY